MPEAVAVQPQAELPLATPAAKPVSKFIIPDDPVVTAPSDAKPVVADSAGATPDAKNTEEQAPSDKPEVEKPEEETPEQAAKRQGRRFERRLGAAYRKAAEAQARAELLEKQLNEVRQSQQAPKVEGEPTLAQFDYDPEKYAAAKADFAKTQTAKELAEKAKTEAQKTAQQALVASWEEKAAQGADKYEDWDEKVGELQPNSAFVAAIMEAENGHEIAYHLGSNPKEAERIAKLPPLSQIREIGKLEAKLLSEPVKPKAPSKAPAPITPLTGTSPVVNDSPSENDDIRDWIRKRQKQVHGKR